MIPDTVTFLFVVFNTFLGCNVVNENTFYLLERRSLLILTFICGQITCFWPLFLYRFKYQYTPSLTDLTTTLHISPIIINTGTPVTICAYINIHIFEEKI